MNKLHAALLLVLSLVATALVATADVHKGDVNKVSKAKNPYMLDGVLDSMQLEDNRADEVKNIMLESREERRAIMEAAKQQVKALQEKRKAQIASLLSDEEMRTFDKAMRNQRKEFNKEWQRCENKTLAKKVSVAKKEI